MAPAALRKIGAMTHPFGPMRLLVNPRAGRGAVSKQLPALRAALEQRKVDYDVFETARGGQMVEATEQALADGVRYLVAVGGDGTVHEVVNGMYRLDEASGEITPIAPDAVLGVVGAGSGSDFVRTFGLDRNVEVLARHLATEDFMPVDVGVVSYVDVNGTPARRLFANIAEVGYGGEVVRRVARYPRFLGRVRYLLGAYASIRALQRQETAVKVAHTTATVPLTELVVANGQFFGGGMKVAPRALPDDGKFNVQLFTGHRSQVFLMTTQIYRGEHLPNREIVEYQSESVELAPDIPLPVEADGEYLGTTPCTFTLLERSLRLKI